ncbi:MAG: FG-GAP-like repeat-containing protein [Actinomycetota bacterium]|nr:FG-GAP-like repeat-containing protein [Actinomycetota bacterium]
MSRSLESKHAVICRLVAAALMAGSAMAVQAVVATPASAGQVGDAGRFDTWTGYDVGRLPVAVVAGDFTGDGLRDVAWARHDFFNNTIAVQRNLGDGTMSGVTGYPATESSTDLSTGDVNGDGHPDLVAVAEGASLNNTTIDLYLGSATGGFTRAAVVGGYAPQRVALADVDGDADLDIATSNGWGATYASVLLNAGDGSFAPERKIAVGAGQLGISAADLDGDGRADLAVAREDEVSNTPEIVVLGLDAAGQLRVKTRLQPPAPDGEQRGNPLVAAGDLTGDGFADLVATGGTATAHVVLRNDGGLSFTALAPVEAGFGSVNLTLADHDGDGDLDVYSATQGSSFTGDVSFLPNTGGGLLGPTQIIESSHQPHDIATADFNGDSRLDMAVANSGSGTGAMHQQGLGTAFEAPPTYPTFAAPDTVATADFNGDAALDVASTIPTGKLVDIKLNNGSGVLNASSTVASGVGSPTSIWAANLNADAAPDLAWAAGGQPPRYAVALNKGDGTFGQAAFLPSATCGMGRVTSADIDGDSDQDVLVGSGQYGGCTGVPDDAVAAHLNNGDGTFTAATYIPLTRLPGMVFGADMNGDGILDLIGASQVANTGDLAVALGSGGGTFSPPRTYSTGAAHRELVVTDLDADGDPDVATVNSGNESTAVLLNDGSGVLGAATVLPAETISNLLNQVAIAAGDINGDGNVDIAVANRSGKDMGVYFGRGNGVFDPQQLRYGMHTDLTDIALADMNADGRLDAVGPTSPESVGFTGAASLNFRAAPAASPASATSPTVETMTVAETSTAVAASAAGVSVLVNKAAAAPQAATLTVTKSGTGGGRVTSVPAGISCGTDCSETYPAGTVVTLTARPAAGSTFQGWTGGCTGTASCQVTMTAARSVGAVFAKVSNPTLTVAKSGTGTGRVTSQPLGISCGTDCSQAYTAGTVVTLTAQPGRGSTFLGWSGPCTGRETCQVTVSAAVTVTARSGRR